MAMAAKAKLLLRELKTVKADLAFAKERCAQLEEENRILREHHEKGDNPEDDDLVCILFLFLLGVLLFLPPFIGLPFWLKISGRCYLVCIFLLSLLNASLIRL